MAPEVPEIRQDVEFQSFAELLPVPVTFKTAVIDADGITRTLEAPSKVTVLIFADANAIGANENADKIIDKYTKTREKCLFFILQAEYTIVEEMTMEKFFLAFSSSQNRNRCKQAQFCYDNLVLFRFRQKM